MFYIQGYGLTESCGIISLEYPQGKDRVYGSTGFLTAGVDGKVISIDTQMPLPPNQLGELCFRGPNIMQGKFYAEKKKQRYSNHLIHFEISIGNSFKIHYGQNLVRIFSFFFPRVLHLPKLVIVFFLSLWKIFL